MGEAAAGAVEEGCVALTVESGPDQLMVRALLCLEQSIGHKSRQKS